MELTAKLIVFFAVQHFDDASYVSELLKISPTEVWTKGDPVPNHPSALRTFSRWSLAAVHSAESTFAEQIESLLPLLEAHRDGVRAAAAQFAAGVHCVAYYYGSTPEVHLPSALLARIATLGLYLDLDLYNLGDDRNES